VGSAESKQDLEKGVITAPITICVARTATKMTENDFDWSIFDFSIFDECHSYCAKGTSKIMLKCTTRYKLSLSASVDHNWNWQLIIYSSGNLIDGNRILGSSVKRLKGVVKVINYHGPEEYTRKIVNFYGDTQVSKMVELFSKDEQRCKMIIGEIGRLIPNHEGIMVIAVSNCMLQVLRDLVGKTYPEVKLGTINQLVSDEEKEYAKKEAQIIFITYMSGTIAVNIPRTTAIVFASSFVNNGIQISGRALRKDYKPDKVREFVDIVDYDAANFKHQLSKRLKVWRERGFEIRSENYPSE
jgi:superfamily II DNA or RNA helicase